MVEKKKPRRKTVKDYSRLLDSQLYHLKKELDGKDSIHRLNKIHNENLITQNRNNIMNEYTRIRNYLENAGPPTTRDTEHLRQRLHHLNKMNIV